MFGYYFIFLLFLFSDIEALERQQMVRLTSVPVSETVVAESHMPSKEIKLPCQ